MQEILNNNDVTFTDISTYKVTNKQITLADLRPTTAKGIQ